MVKYEYKAEKDWPWLWAIQKGMDLDYGLPDEEKNLPKHFRDDYHIMPICMVEPYLYLGNHLCVLDIDNLVQKKITHILNVAGKSIAMPDPNVFEKAGIVYHEVSPSNNANNNNNDGNIQEEGIPPQDCLGYPMLEYHWDSQINNVLQMIKDTENAKVVVHCMGGWNRSSLIVATEMMVRCGYNVLEAVLRIRQLRGEMALFNESFQEQLVAFARTHDMLGPHPTSYPKGFLKLEKVGLESERAEWENEWEEIVEEGLY